MRHKNRQKKGPACRPCVRDRQSVPLVRQGSLGLVPRRHCERPSARGHTERGAMRPAGRKGMRKKSFQCVWFCQLWLMLYDEEEERKGTCKILAAPLRTRAPQRYDPSRRTLVTPSQRPTREQKHWLGNQLPKLLTRGSAVSLKEACSCLWSHRGNPLLGSSLPVCMPRHLLTHPAALPDLDIWDRFVRT